MRLRVGTSCRALGQRAGVRAFARPQPPRMNRKGPHGTVGWTSPQHRRCYGHKQGCCLAASPPHLQAPRACWMSCQAGCDARALIVVSSHPWPGAPPWSTRRQRTRAC